MSDDAQTHFTYTYNPPTNTLTTLVASKVPHQVPAKGEITIRVHATALNPVDVQLAGWLPTKVQESTQRES